MAHFSYEGRNARGELVKGVLEGVSSNSVADQLFNTGITPIKIDQAADAAVGGELLESVGGQGALRRRQAGEHHEDGQNPDADEEATVAKSVIHFPPVYLSSRSVSFANREIKEHCLQSQEGLVRERSIEWFMQNIRD